MRISKDIVVSAPPQVVWEYVSNLDNYLKFMAGMTRWDAEGEVHSGLGARRKMLMKVGSAEVGGLIEFVEWDEPKDLAWSSVSGVDQRGRVRLRPVGERRTRVEFRYAYGVAGAGFFGWISEKVSAPTIAGNISRSLHQLKRLVEQERSRHDAEARRLERETAGT
jgi:uncharacterized membrane protein